MKPIKWEIKCLSNLDFSWSSKWILKIVWHNSGVLTNIPYRALLCPRLWITVTQKLVSSKPLLTSLIWIMGHILMFLLRFCSGEMPSKCWRFPFALTRWIILLKAPFLEAVTVRTCSSTIFSREAAQADRRLRFKPRSPLKLVSWAKLLLKTLIRK